MGLIKAHPPVKLIIGATYAPGCDLEYISTVLEKSYSAVEQRSESYDFCAFTDYYDQEMGNNLSKLFLVFSRLIAPGMLPEIKVVTNRIEETYAQQDRRTINLDPGYISEAKLVLATTKNYAHRIYLDKGIFGDVHLVYTNQAFRTQPWTYPDYQQKSVLDFFTRVRTNYLHQLGNNNS